MKAVLSRRERVTAILSPPTVRLLKLKPKGLGGRPLMDISTFDLKFNRPYCSLCNCTVEDGTSHSGCEAHNLREMVRTMMTQVGLTLGKDDMSFCPFCQAQLWNLVSLKMDVERLGERLATMIIGLHSLLSAKSPDSFEDDDCSKVGILDDTIAEQDDGNDEQQSSPVAFIASDEDDFDYKPSVLEIEELTTTMDAQQTPPPSPSSHPMSHSEPSLPDGPMPEANEKKYLIPKKRVTKRRAKKVKWTRFECPKCGKSVSTARYLKVHIDTHNSNRDKPFLCHICSRRFPTKDDLRVHLKTHLPESERPHPCKLCPRRFPNTSKLKEHIMSRHAPADARRVVCHTCNKTFVNKRGLKLHTPKHTGDLPFVCQVCSKAFSKEYILKNHALLHTNEKPHVCHICSKRFTGKGPLTLHLVTHLPEGERPHSCDHCARRFAVKNELKRHVKIHSDTREKAHVCHICPCSFTERMYLNAHLKRHVEEQEKTHCCSLCPLRFVNKANLKRHAKVHFRTADKPGVGPKSIGRDVKCYFCQELITSRILVAHLRTHTLEQPVR